MKNYKMDFETKTLIVTREFAKGLEKMASKECKIYMHFKGLVPDLKIAYRTHITNKPNHNKGLTYKKMERFIKTYSNSDELLDEFNKVVEYAGFMNNSYAIVNKWFRMQFPDYGKMPTFVNGELYVTPIPCETVMNEDSVA